MPRPPSRLLPLAPLLLLAACGDLPQPFAGNPGGEADRLSVPTATRLDVPPPGNALLGDAEARSWTRSLVAALLDKQVPAVDQPARRGDWSLTVTASLDGARVTPLYRIVGPDGRVRATQPGTPVPAQAWSSPDPSLIAANAAAASITVNAMLTSLQQQAAQADPDSLLNRPTRIWFTGVTGAPGNGDSELADQMRAALPDEHDTLHTDQAHADYLLTGQVSISRPDGAIQHIEIVWTVTRALNGKPGHEAGKATQLHDVPASSLDGAWGDTAIAVAQEAAGGIHEVIANNEGKRQLATVPPRGALPRPEAGSKRLLF